MNRTLSQKIKGNKSAQKKSLALRKSARPRLGSLGSRPAFCAKVAPVETRFSSAESRAKAKKECDKIANTVTRVKNYIELYKLISSQRRKLTTGEILDNIIEYINMMKVNTEETLDELAELREYVRMIKQATEKSEALLVPILSDEVLRKYAKTAKKLVATDENA